MAEGLSPAEVSKEIAEHREKQAEHRADLISMHFRFKSARYGLVTVGIIVLILAVGTLTTLPGPPT